MVTLSNRLYVVYENTPQGSFWHCDAGDAATIGDDVGLEQHEIDAIDDLEPGQDILVLEGQYTVRRDE